ncbi:MAG: ferrous iron transporter B [Thermoclostridium sp.]|nr:ferrous iron transporter B [Thermoclostridium sp.]
MKVLLIGNPNVGKSAVFTQLTGINVKTSNYPGTTVTYTTGTLTVIKSGTACTSCAGGCGGCQARIPEKIEVIDVPGTYRLDPECEAEQVACRMLPQGDMYVNIIDATNLERNLNLTLQLLEFGKPVIVVLNMWDDTLHKGISIDVPKLSELLGVPVVTTTGVTGTGIDTLIRHIMNYPHETVRERKFDNRWQTLGEIVTAVQNLEHRHHTFLERLQDLSVHPLAGVPIALIVLTTLFQVIIIAGEFLIGLMEKLFEWLYTPVILFISRLLGGQGVVHQILLGDISGEKIDYEAAMGVLTTGVFMELGLVFPYILIFYIVLGFLEDLGYLPRVAVLFDRFMHKVGLHGFSIIPMMLALGCNVPGIMAVRNLESRRQRFITATLTAITIPCLAQSAIIFSLTASYGLGTVAAILITIVALWMILGSILRLTIKGTTDTLIMEVPPYRLPGMKVLLRNLGTRLVGFLTDAFPYVLGGILFVNILTLLGVMDFLGNLARPLITGVFGLPGEAVASYIVGIIRKDAAVALLEPLALNSSQMVTGATTLIIYFPCMATFVVLLKELGLKDTTKSFLIMAGITLAAGIWMRALLGLVNNVWIYNLLTMVFAAGVMLLASQVTVKKEEE